MNFDESDEGNHMSLEHSSRKSNEDKNEGSMAGTEGHGEAPQSHGFLTFDGEDPSSTIYHVPSFLLKTYEIVDVRNCRNLIGIG